MPAMPQAKPAAEDAAVAQVTARLSAEFVLRAFQVLVDVYGDIRAGLFVHAINIANLAHIDPQADEIRQAAGPSGVLPDEMRRPISVARLADASGLPFESARRAVQQLISVGACERVPGGVIIPGAVVARPENLRGVVVNLGNVRKFMRDLHAAGVIDHVPASLAVAAGEDGTAAARLVARQTSEYVQQALRLLADTYVDTRAGVVAQTIVAANTAYLDTRGGEGWRYARIDEAPPDEARRPISIGRVAESLGLPYETTRRYVARLLETKVCVRVRGGVIVPRAVLDGPRAVRATLANVGYVRKFARELDAAPV
ncbi:MAG TPA: hypothetical protein VN694_07495 [Caulobacteraceae bacterium]|nr:hypothetical protein [Caulobacteraceae bacterium]